MRIPIKATDPANATVVTVVTVEAVTIEIKFLPYLVVNNELMTAKINVLLKLFEYDTSLSKVVNQF